MLRKFCAAAVIMAAVSSVTAFGADADQASRRLYGTVIYSNGDAVANGVYSFNLTGSPEQEAIPAGKDLEANGGGFFANGCYYFNQEVELYGSTYRYHYIYEFPSWNRVSRSSFSNKYDMANDMAYDPMLGCAFGCFPDGTACFFGSVSIPNFKVERIGEALPVEYAGIAIDAEGTVYAIDNQGELFTVDKFTGAATSVGKTGLAAKYQSSAVFDDEAKVIYYSVNTEDASKLYTIDPATAAATFVYDFPNDEQVVGLFIPVEQNAEAPAAVSSLAVAPDKGNLAANVSFTMPAKTYSDAELTGNIDYEVRVNDVVKATGSAAAGSEKTVAVEVAAKGDYTFTVFAIKDGLRSIVAMVRQYVGNDTPVAVKNAKSEYSAENGGFTVSWDAVSDKGVNGGYVNPEMTTYTVVRFPDEVVVAEATSELSIFNKVAEPEEGLVQYYYTVTPAYAGATGEAAKTNGISLGTIVPPYDQPFGSADALSGYTIIPNSSSFNNVWKYQSMAVKGPKGSWLITPAMKLTGGCSYDITYDMKSEYGYVEESMSIYLGSQPAADAMTTEVLPSTSIKSTSYKDFKATMEIISDGTYYLGFICDSQSWNSYGVYVKNFKISAAQYSGVEAVSTENAVAIYAAAGAVAVSSPAPVAVEVFNMSGMRVASATVNGEASVPVAPGIYIVRAGSATAKVVVR